MNQCKLLPWGACILWIVLNSVWATNYDRNFYKKKLLQPVDWDVNLWIQGGKYAADYRATRWPEAARVLIRHIRMNAAEGAYCSYDGVGIEGMNYSYLYLGGIIANAAPVMGYTDGNYNPPPGYQKITNPLILEDLLPRGKRSLHFITNGMLMALPDGSDCGAHDTGIHLISDLNDLSEVGYWGSGNEFFFFGCERKAVSYLLGGFGQIGLGDGKVGDPYMQVQALLHFSPKNSYHPVKPGTGHAANDTLMFGLYGRGRNLISFPGHQNQYHMPRNKNLVLVQNKMQSHYHSDLAGHLEVYCDMPGLKVARVDGSHIIWSDGPSGFGTLTMNRYRRTIILNTVDVARAYAVDIFEVDGGTEHTYQLAGSMVREQSDPVTSLAV